MTVAQHHSGQAWVHTGRPLAVRSMAQVVAWVKETERKQERRKRWNMLVEVVAWHLEVVNNASALFAACSVR